MLYDTQVMVGDSPLEGISFSPQDLSGIERMLVAVSLSPSTNNLLPGLVQDPKNNIVGGYALIIPKKSPYGFTDPMTIFGIASQSEIVGFKLMTSILGIAVDDPIMDQYYGIAERFKKPFLIHCSKDGEEYVSNEKIENVLSKHPTLKLILAQFGGLKEEYMRKRMELVKKYPENLWLNTTGMSGYDRQVQLTENGIHILEERLDEDLRRTSLKILTEAMADPVLRTRILHGTDAPYLTADNYPASELPDIDQQQLDQNARELLHLV